MSGATFVTVIYGGPFSEVITPDGVIFKRGEPVDVPAGQAETLINQNFTIKKETK